MRFQALDTPRSRWRNTEVRIYFSPNPWTPKLSPEKEGAPLGGLDPNPPTGSDP